MTNVHLLKLRSHLQADAFEIFGRDRYLPALRTDPSRAGLLLSARLLRRRRRHESDPISLDTEFLLIFEWSGVSIDLPPVDDATVQSVFQTFKIEATKIGEFEDIAAAVGEAM
jgi:hypothetical protein